MMLAKSVQDKNNKNCIFVLGMHRSGTSALTGVLNLLGFDLGRTMMTIDTSQNSKGFFENFHVHRINEKIFKENNYSWDSFFPFPLKEINQEKYNQYKEEIKSVIKSEFANNHEKIAIKDPRICLLFPIWKEAMIELGWNIYTISIIRHPIDVAKSLKKRNNFSHEKSFLIQLNYLFNAEFNSRDNKRSYLLYQSLLSEPVQILEKLNQQLGLPLFENTDTSKIEDFLENSLNHYNSKDKDIFLLSPLYSFLNDLTRSNCKEKVVIRKIDRLNSTYINALPIINYKPSNTAFEKKINSNQSIRQNYFAQVFLDIGKGFQESDSIKMEINSKTTLIEFRLDKFKKIKNIRFDPCNHIGLIQFKDIILKFDNHKIHKVKFKSNALADLGEDTYLFDTDDSNLRLEYEFDEDPILLTVKVAFQAIGKKAYKLIVSNYKHKVKKLQKLLTDSEKDVKDYANRIDNLLTAKLSSDEDIDLIAQKENDIKLLEHLVAQKELLLDEITKTHERQLSLLNDLLSVKDKEILHYKTNLETRAIHIKEVEEKIKSSNINLDIKNELISKKNIELGEIVNKLQQANAQLKLKEDYIEQILFQYDNTKNENDHLNTTIDKRETLIQQIQTELNNSSNENIHLKNIVADKENHINEIQTQLNNFLNENTHLKNVISEKDDKTHDIQTQLHNSTNENTHLKNIIADRENNINSIQVRLDTSVNENTHLKITIDEKQKALDDSEETLLRLKDKNSELDNKLEEHKQVIENNKISLQNYFSESEAFKKTILNKETIINLKQDTIEALHDENDKLKSVIDHHNDVLNEKQLQLDDLYSENNDLKNVINKNKKLIVEKQGMINFIADEKDQLLSKLSNREYVIRDTQDQINITKQKLAQSHKTIIEREKANSDLLQTNNHLLEDKKNLTDQLSNVLQEKTNLTKVIEKNDQLLEQYHKEIELRGKNTDDIRASFSYRLGRTITFPVRFIYDRFFLFESEAPSQGTRNWLIWNLIKESIKNPVKAFKNINSKNINTLRKALQNESPAIIKKNFDNLLSQESEGVQPNSPQIISTNNELKSLATELASSNIKIKGNETDSIILICDSINSTMHKLEINGWSISPDGIDHIAFYSGGILLGKANYGLPRPDVAQQFPQIKNSNGAGFRFITMKEYLLNGDIEIKSFDLNGNYKTLLKKDSYLTLDQQYAKFQEKNNSEDYSRQIVEGIKKFKTSPLISIIISIQDTPKLYLDKMINSLLSQYYKNYEIIIENSSNNQSIIDFLQKVDEKHDHVNITFNSSKDSISESTNNALNKATGEYVLFINSGDELSPDALFHFVSKINTNPTVDLIYSDEDQISKDFSLTNPHFKSDFNPDMLLSLNYIGDFFVVKNFIGKKLNWFNDKYGSSFKYDFLLRVSYISKNIEHISKVLYHKRNDLRASNEKNKDIEVLNDYISRTKIDASISTGLVPNSYRLKRKIKSKKLVSIVIPFKDDIETLKTCINSVFEKTYYKNFELILVSNSSKEKETFDYLNTFKRNKQVKVYEYNIPFNYSKICNWGVTQSKGDYILLLNNDIEVINRGWLSSMVEHAQRKEVGAVGSKLLYPDGTIQHAGVILNLGGLAAHCHKYFPDSAPGYFSRANIIQNLSICTAACLLLRREVFNEVNGLDEENLGVAFNDVDLCMKIREKDYLIVYTPFSKLYHYESKSRGLDDTPEKRERSKKEISFFRDKWKKHLDNGDPYYNKNLTLTKKDFSLNI